MLYPKFTSSTPMTSNHWSKISGEKMWNLGVKGETIIERKKERKK
jgi:hypothetical protein